MAKRGDTELFVVSVGYEVLAVGTIEQATRLIALLAKMTVVDNDYDNRDEQGRPRLKRRTNCECSLKGGLCWAERRTAPGAGAHAKRPALKADVRRCLPDPLRLPLSPRRLLSDSQEAAD